MRSLVVLIRSVPFVVVVGSIQFEREPGRRQQRPLIEPDADECPQQPSSAVGRGSATVREQGREPRARRVEV
jgi:hypothetical protein